MTNCTNKFCYLMILTWLLFLLFFSQWSQGPRPLCHRQGQTPPLPSLWPSVSWIAGATSYGGLSTRVARLIHKSKKIFKSVSNSDLNLWNLLCASVFINQLMYCILQFIRTCVCMQVLLYWYTVCKYTVLKAICTATKWPQVYLQPTVALWPLGVRMYPSIISISCSAGGLAVWGNLSTRYFQVACAPLNETEVNMCVCPDCSQEIIYTTTS